MSVITAVPFGDPQAIVRAAAANAAHARALQLGYSDSSARTFARQARMEASEREDAADTAMRIVYPPRGVFVGPGGGAA